MFGKGSRLYSIFNSKCPKCNEGNFFVSHPYDLAKIGDLHEHCDKCGLKYEKEPGFYYGAMYVAYGLGVALFVALWVSFYLFFNNISLGWLIGSIIVGTIVLSPYIYTMSKIIWANLFIKFDKDAIKHFKESTHS